MKPRSLIRRNDLTADKRAWIPKEVGDALVEAGHAAYDANSGTFYVNGSALELIPVPHVDPPDVDGSGGPFGI